MHLFRYRAWLEGNLLRCVRARAHVGALMTRKSCVVRMCNAILRNYVTLRYVTLCYVTLCYVTMCFLVGHVGRAERDRWSLCHQSVKEGCHRSRWWCWVHHDREESSGITRQTAFPDISFLLFPVLCESSILLLNIIIKFIPIFFFLICREPTMWPSAK